MGKGPFFLYGYYKNLSSTDPIDGDEKVQVISFLLLAIQESFLKHIHQELRCIIHYEKSFSSAGVKGKARFSFIDWQRTAERSWFKKHNNKIKKI